MADRAVRDKIIIGLLFLAFLAPRIFVASPYYFVSMDEAKYLGLARNFPAHTLFNRQLFVVHPPIFPYLIRFFTPALPDHTAGITVSLLASLLSFFLLLKLFRLFDKSFRWIVFALVILTVSPLHIPTSRVVYKDSLFFALFLSSLYSYLRGLLRSRPAWLLAAGIFGGAGCLTSDLGVYLFPCFLLGYFVFRKRDEASRQVDWKIMAATFALAFLPYLAWLGVRYVIFSNNLYYPAGVDGTLEYVRDFTARRLFTPRYFPLTAKMFDFSFDPTHLSLHGNVYPLEPLVNLPGFIYGAFYLVAAVTALLTIIGAFVKGGMKENPAFFFSLLLVLFALPVVLHPEPRFLFPILLPMIYLFAEAIAKLTSRTPRLNGCLAWGTVALLLILGAAYLSGHRYPVFTLEKEVESFRTAEFLEGLSGEGVMAQVGYPPELAYLTGKRVTALPPSPEKLDELIRLFEIDYLVYGGHYWAPVERGSTANVWCYETIRHIRQNPDRYPLLEIIEEEYRSRRWPDRIFIHAVARDR